VIRLPGSTWLGVSTPIKDAANFERVNHRLGAMGEGSLLSRPLLAVALFQLAADGLYILIFEIMQEITTI
jgi:hypothetical protein